MDENNLKQLWLNSGGEQKVEINTEKLVESLSQKSSSVEQRIKKRDRREIFIGICMIPLFGWWMISVPQLLGKIGAAIIVAACFLVIFKLVRAKKTNRKQDVTSEIRHSLVISHQLLNQQIKLLNTVLWWYFLPFFIGVTCFYFSAVNSILSRLIYTIVTATAYGYIYYLNKRAVKKHLKPLEENLTKVLQDLSVLET